MTRKAAEQRDRDAAAAAGGRWARSSRARWARTSPARGRGPGRAPPAPSAPSRCVPRACTSLSLSFCLSVFLSLRPRNSLPPSLPPSVSLPLSLSPSLLLSLSLFLSLAPSLPPSLDRSIDHSLAPCSQFRAQAHARSPSDNLDVNETGIRGWGGQLDGSSLENLLHVVPHRRVKEETGQCQVTAAKFSLPDSGTRRFRAALGIRRQAARSS